MELCFLISDEEIEEEIRKGRVQRKENGGFDISIENKIQLFEENKLIAFVTVDFKQIAWNPARDRDPRIKGNKNGGEGGGFRFSPYFHLKGKLLQDVTKLGMIKAIETAHKQIIGGYDQDAYKFDDPRLLDLNTFLQVFIGDHFGDAGAGPRKLDFMYQLADIILFLMKEDIYYRARFLKLFNEVPGNWQLTEVEEKNLKNWD